MVDHCEITIIAIHPYPILKAANSYSLIINPSLVMYQEMHPNTAISIASGKINMYYPGSYERMTDPNRIVCTEALEFQGSQCIAMTNGAS